MAYDMQSSESQMMGIFAFWFFVVQYPTIRTYIANAVGATYFTGTNISQLGCIANSVVFALLSFLTCSLMGVEVVQKTILMAAAIYFVVSNPLAYNLVNGVILVQDPTTSLPTTQGSLIETLIYVGVLWLLAPKGKKSKGWMSR